MTTTIRTSRFPDFRNSSGGSQDDSLTSPRQSSLGNTISGNASAWNSNIWRNGSIGRTTELGNREGSSIRDLSNAREEDKQGSSSLVAESDPWTRRTSNWTSTESSTSPVEQRRNAAFPDLGLRTSRQYTTGRPAADGRSDAFSSSSAINFPPTGATTLQMNAFESAGDGHPRMQRRAFTNHTSSVANRSLGEGRENTRQPVYTRWPDSAVSLSPTDTSHGGSNANASVPERDGQGYMQPSLYNRVTPGNWHKRENISWSQDPCHDLFDRPEQIRSGSIASSGVIGRATMTDADISNAGLSSNFEKLSMGTPERGRDHFAQYSPRRASGSNSIQSVRDQYSGWSRFPAQPGLVQNVNSAANSGLPSKILAVDNQSNAPHVSSMERFDALQHARDSGVLSPLSSGVGGPRSFGEQHIPVPLTSHVDNQVSQHGRNNFGGQNTVNSRVVACDRTFRPMNQDQEQLMQQQMQQMMTSQMYGQYCPPTPWASSTDRALSQIPVPQYHMTPGMGARQIQQDLESNQSLRSDVLEDFKSHHKGSRRWELREIYDHIVEFSGDQHGSRFIQHKLESANSEEKERVFREIQPNATQLMTDVFGNYVIQKFFEHGDQYQKKILANKMKGRILNLSLQIYGCRVVQKALEHVLVDQQASMVQELNGDGVVLRCIKDQNGNHVIQKAIERVPLEHVGFIIEVSLSQIRSLAIHGYGCRVVQRLLERCDQRTKAIMLQELHACASTLIPDHFGNYVTQHVIESGSVQDRDKLISLVLKNLIPYSRQKCASNVVEKCIIYSTDEQRHEMMLQFTAKNSQGESVLPMLIKDQFANYVIQRLLDTLNPVDYAMFTAALEPEIAKFTSRKLLPNKQAENVAKKMHRFDSPQGVISNGFGARMNSSDSSALPTPPLTSDGLPTPMSTSLSSTHGDWSTTSQEGDTISGAVEPGVKHSAVRSGDGA